MPQLDFSLYATQIFWLAVCFIALYVVMSRVALPQIADVMERRRVRIDGDLAKAEAAKEQAKAVIHDYQRALAQAKTDAQKLIQKQHEESAKKIAIKQKKFVADLAFKSSTAEEKIRKVRAQADEVMPEIAADIAAVISAKFTKRKLMKEDIRKTVSTIIDA